MAAPQALRKNGSPKGIRTPVTGLRTRRPRPLDDGTPLTLAGEPGFEPGLPDPESGVLPLHHSPLSNEDSFYRLLRKSQGFARRLSHRTEPAPSPALRAACHIARRPRARASDAVSPRSECQVCFPFCPVLDSLRCRALLGAQEEIFPGRTRRWPRTNDKSCRLFLTAAFLPDNIGR